jgi:aspartyl-tRNA(Asn)/glutamyl-tRNA(Gln) amidotransferase subunit A
MSAGAIAASVRGRQMSAVSVAEAALSAIAVRNPELNAYTAVLAERALAEARAVDSKIANGDDPGMLGGVPYGVKNLFDVAGHTTRAGSRINRDLPPAATDAVLVQRLERAGAVLLGMQNMDEYAYGFTTENAHDGPTHNPRALGHSAGGSSGGSAASVAAGLGAFALASDTNGSIRVPASFCGIFGLKPTYGRLPRTGSFPFVFDLDHLGVLARHATDLALIYDVLQGADASDPGCAARAPDAASPSLQHFPRDLRIGLLGGWFEDMAEGAAIEAVRLVASALGARSKVDLPGAEGARAAAFLITAAQAANLHRENLAQNAEKFDPATRGRLLAGALLPAGFVLQAQRVRRWFSAQVADVFRSFDILLAPATPCSATKLGQANLHLNGMDMPARPSIGLLTQPISCIGLPVVAVPVQRQGALPIGVQIIAPPWQEARALQVAARLEALGVVSAPVAA